MSKQFEVDYNSLIVSFCGFIAFIYIYTYTSIEFLLKQKTHYINSNLSLLSQFWILLTLSSPANLLIKKSFMLCQMKIFTWLISTTICLLAILTFPLSRGLIMQTIFGGNAFVVNVVSRSFKRLVVPHSPCGKFTLFSKFSSFLFSSGVFIKGASWTLFTSDFTFLCFQKGWKFVFNH